MASKAQFYTSLAYFLILKRWMCSLTVLGISRYGDISTVDVILKIGVVIRVTEKDR